MDSLGSADSVGSVDSADSLGSVGQSVSGFGQRWTFLAVVLPGATHLTRLSQMSPLPVRMVDC